MLTTSTTTNSMKVFGKVQPK